MSFGRVQRGHRSRARAGTVNRWLWLLAVLIAGSLAWLGAFLAGKSEARNPGYELAWAVAWILFFGAWLAAWKFVELVAR